MRIPVTRAQFESWIAEDLAAIEHSINALLSSTATAAGDVDLVFLTGGTSFVPAVRRIFNERFGQDRIRGGSEFTSVAQGLALRGQQLVGSDPVMKIYEESVCGNTPHKWLN